MKSMSLTKWLSNSLKHLLIPLQVNFTLFLFLRGMPISEILSIGGREILGGTALLPDKGFHVADVGAFRGWYTVLAGKLVGLEGHVYAFEPEPGNFQVLWRVCLLSGLRNLTLYKLALSDKDGIERMYISEYPSMHSIVLRRGGSVIDVKSIRLDTLVSLGAIPRLDLVKVDVEGAELKVLRGAKSSISKFSQ